MTGPTAAHLAVIAATLWAACHSPSPPALKRAAVPPAPIAPRGRPLDPAVIASASFWVAGAGDGARDLVLGSLRVEVRNGAVQIAADRFASEILVAVPIGGGWLFVAGDGAIARSDTYLGPLQLLGEISPRYRPVRGSRGRLAIVDDTGRVWLDDGSGAPAPVALSSPALVAAFADAASGAVIVDGGALLHTEDGGEHWAMADLAGEAALDIALAGPDLLVHTSAGPRRLTRDGSLVAPGAAPPAPAISPVEASELRARLRHVVITPGTVIAATQSARPDADLPERWSFDDYRCSPHGEAMRVARVSVPTRNRVLRRVHLQRAGSLGELASWRGGADWWARAAWRGTDDRGAFRALSNAARWPVTNPADDEMYPESTPYLLYGAWRNGLLIERCAQEQACDLLWWRSGGGVIAIRRPELPAGEGVDLALEQGLPSDEGGLVLRFGTRLVMEPLVSGADRGDSTAVAPLQLRLDAIVILEADGRLRERRVFLWLDPDAPAGLMHRGSQLGYGMISRGAARLRLVPLSSSGNRPPLTLPAISVSPIRPCRGLAAAGSVVLHGVPFGGAVISSRLDIPIESVVSASIEMSPIGSCLRSLEAPQPPRPDNASGFYVVATDAGTLSGVAEEGERQWKIECRISVAN
jgi:hypothetical protein